MKDVVVIGGGVNGLTTACLLAKAGRRVIVLEARDHIGGLAARDSFHRGYSAPGILQDTSGFRGEVVRALDLGRHGLRRRAKPAAIPAAPPMMPPVNGLASATPTHDASDDVS